MTRKYYTEPERDVYVEATKEDLKEAKKILFEAKLKGEEANCPHTVFWDEDSFMYAMRTCFACGTIIEMI